VEAQWVDQRAHLRHLFSLHPEWTMHQLADAIGCSLSMVSTWRRRFAEADPDDVSVLFSRSRAPHHHPPRIDEPTGCATRLKGENVTPSSPGLASTHSIERRPLSTAQGCKDGTSSIIQRAECHNARIHVVADQNTNILEFYRQPFFRRRISPQKQL
jgi:hypothetical protein